VKVLATIFLLFCFFPYIDLLGIGTDTQPNALIVGALILLTTTKNKINTPLILLWLLFFCSLFLFFKNNLSFFIYLKNSFNYLSLPLVAMASYTLFSRYRFKVSYKFFLYTISIYAVVGLVQLYLKPDFLGFLLNDARGVMVHGRGVIALCPEPAFYGSLCLFFVIFSLLNYSKKQNYLIIPFLLFQLAFLSRSATAVAILGLSITIFTLIQICRLKVLYILSSCLILAIAIPFYQSQLQKLEETRIGQITADFIEDPLMVTQIDDSVGIRFAGAVSPFLALRYNNFMPMGIGHYREFLKKLYVSGKHRRFLNPTIVNGKERLGGSMNAVLFQLGIVGIILPLAIFLAFYGRLHEDKYLFSLILFSCLLFTQLQLMLSMIGFTIGYVLHKTRQRPDLS